MVKPRIVIQLLRQINRYIFIPVNEGSMTIFRMKILERHRPAMPRILGGHAHRTRKTARLYSHLNQLKQMQITVLMLISVIHLGLAMVISTMMPEQLMLMLQHIRSGGVIRRGAVGSQMERRRIVCLGSYGTTDLLPMSMNCFMYHEPQQDGSSRTTDQLIPRFLFNQRSIAMESMCKVNTTHTLIMARISIIHLEPFFQGTICCP